MKVSSKRQDEILARISETEPDCVLCGTTDWHLSDTVFELREFQEGGELRIGGETSILPVLPLTCTSCGYTHLLNIVVLGIAEEELEGSELEGPELEGPEGGSR